MKIEYDVPDLPRRRGDRRFRCETTVAFQEFMESDRKNMVITYDDEKDAKRTRDTLYHFRRAHQFENAVDLYCMGSKVVLVKTGGKS